MGPRRARLTKVRQRSEKKNQMGDKEEHIMTYTENLLLELDQLGWSTMSQAEAGCLLWLQDLSTSNKHQVDLSKRIHESWNTAKAHRDEVTVQNCLTIALDHCGKVHETKLTMSRPQDKAQLLARLQRSCSPK